jgi:hypothetical protein
MTRKHNPFGTLGSCGLVEWDIASKIRVDEANHKSVFPEFLLAYGMGLTKLKLKEFRECRKN